MKTFLVKSGIENVACSVLAFALLFLPSFSGIAADRILLRAADSYPVDYPTAAGLMEMARYLEEKTEGRIRVILYPDAELGSERETIEMTQIGALDIARVSAVGLAEFSSAMELLTLPYLFRNEDHLWAVLESDIGKRLLNELAEQKVIGLCFYEAGARGFYTLNKPIWRPEDLESLKIRTPYSRIIRDIVKSVKAVPTEMTLGEVYSALQLGVIDGAEGSLPAYYTRRHYEEAKYYTMSEHSRVPDVVIMSQQSWNELSAQDQLLIQRAAQESAKHERRLWHQLEDEALAAVRERGVEVIPVNREVQALFLKAMEPVRKKYRKRHLELMVQVIPDVGIRN